jgi:precorrin-6x reductase
MITRLGVVGGTAEKSRLTPGLQLTTAHTLVYALASNNRSRQEQKYATEREGRLETPRPNNKQQQPQRPATMMTRLCLDGAHTG